MKKRTRSYKLAQQKKRHSVAAPSLAPVLENPLSEATSARHSSLFSYTAPEVERAMKPVPSVNHEGLAEQIFSYKSSLIYQDLRKTVIVTLTLLALLLGGWWLSLHPELRQSIGL